MPLYQPVSFINGQWEGATSGATFDVINPATGDVIEKVADLSAAGLRQSDRMQLRRHFQSGRH